MNMFRKYIFCPTKRLFKFRIKYYQPRPPYLALCTLLASDYLTQILFVAMDAQRYLKMRLQAIVSQQRLFSTKRDKLLKCLNLGRIECPFYDPTIARVA